MISTENQKIYSMPLRGCVNIQLGIASSPSSSDVAALEVNDEQEGHRRRSQTRSNDACFPLFKGGQQINSKTRHASFSSTTIDIKTVKAVSDDKRRQISSILRKDFIFKDNLPQINNRTVIHLDELDDAISLNTPTNMSARDSDTPPLTPPPIIIQKNIFTTSFDNINPLSLNEVRQSTSAAGAAFNKQYSNGNDRSADSAVGTSLVDDENSTILPQQLNNGEAIEAIRYVRIAFYQYKDISVLLKISCASKLKHASLYKLMISIAEACRDVLKKKKTNLITLGCHELNKLTFTDKRPTKEHVSALCRRLSEDVILHEANCQRSTKTFHVGHSLKNILHKTTRCEIAESAVLVTLTSLNKIAPVQEFIDQLCSHIEVAKPTELGNPHDVTLGRRPERLEKAAKYQLLSQSFTQNGIISVAEAANRSFIRIESFRYYI